jgi:hypothetical protein
MMEKPSAGMRRALRQAQVHGHLVARYGGLYRPGGTYPACGFRTAQEMVRSGWLTFRGGRYEITPAGRRAIELGADHEQPRS